MAVNGTPRNGAARNGSGPSMAKPMFATYGTSSPRERQKVRQQKTSNRTTNKSRTKNGGFHIHINEAPRGSSNGGHGSGAAGGWSRQSPIGDAEFLSAGHIRAFAERGRRSMRQAAMDFSYAAETLRAVLREVPAPQDKGVAHAMLRANRVARSLKKAANAAQAASAHSARTWPAFMREYAPELNTYGGPRPRQPRYMNFGA